MRKKVGVETMKFNKGDRVFHKNLKLIGEFVEYDWTGEDECWVKFDNPDDSDDCRHVSTNQLQKESSKDIAEAIKRYNNLKRK